MPTLPLKNLHIQRVTNFRVQLIGETVRKNDTLLWKHNRVAASVQNAAKVHTGIATLYTDKFAQVSVGQPHRHRLHPFGAQNTG